MARFGLDQRQQKASRPSPAPRHRHRARPPSNARLPRHPPHTAASDLVHLSLTSLSPLLRPNTDRQLSAWNRLESPAFIWSRNVQPANRQPLQTFHFQPHPNCSPLDLHLVRSELHPPDFQPLTFDYLPPSTSSRFNCSRLNFPPQPSTLNLPPPAFDHRRSTFHLQNPTFNPQPCTFHLFLPSPFRPRALTFYLRSHPSTLNLPSSAFHAQPSTFTSIFNLPPSTFPPTTFHPRLSTNFPPSTFHSQPSTLILSSNHQQPNLPPSTLHPQPSTLSTFHPLYLPPSTFHPPSTFNSQPSPNPPTTNNRSPPRYRPQPPQFTQPHSATAQLHLY